jgi:hypothetical protein
LTTSVQVAAWHRFGAPEQTPLWQSPATVQSPFVAQPLQVPPPQSTSVSAPLRVVSAQLGAWHTPPEQTLLWQSPPVPHCLPVAQLPQLPPQSTSLSLPFRTPSLQLAASQLPPRHTPLWQSSPVRQSALVAHLAAQLPPQSVSDSLPFFTESLHVGARQVLGVPKHTRLAQSSATRHVLPSAQSAQLAPPQSVSVSVPFRLPSLQLASWHVPFKQFTPATQSAVPPQLWPAKQRALPQAAPQSTSPSSPFLTPSLQLGA